MPGFEIESVLSGTKRDLSGKVLCMNGVNLELMPFIRMTAPVNWRETPIREWPQGSTLFRSVVLLFGIFPVDFHHFKLINASDDFIEESSSSLINKAWDHRRSITDHSDGCRIHDQVEYDSRLHFIGGVLKPLYKAVFKHRHRRLRAKYGVTSH